MKSTAAQATTAETLWLRAAGRRRRAGRAAGGSGGTATTAAGAGADGWHSADGGWPRAVDAASGGGQRRGAGVRGAKGRGDGGAAAPHPRVAAEAAEGVGLMSQPGRAALLCRCAP